MIKLKVMAEVGGAGSYNGNQVIKFDASLTVPISKENRPVNVGVKYIIKAK